MKKIWIIALALMAFTAVIETAHVALADNPVTPTGTGGKRK